MSEKQTEQEKENPEEIQRIRLQRHLWPDEIEKKKMKKKISHLKVWLIVLTVCAFLGGWLFGSFSPIPYFHTVKQAVNSVTKSDSTNKFNEILDIMSNDWYFAKDIDSVSERLTDQALYGMTTNEEDPHTSYMSKDEMDSFTQSINMNFVGIGVEFISTNGLNMIERVYKNSPAEKAGVQPGDIMHAVDGTVVDGMSSTDIAALVKGEEGTDVVIDFIRNGETVTLTITRAEITTTAYGYVMDDGTGYLQLSRFGESSAKEVKAYLDDFQEQNVTKLILDLRDNGGGYLDALQNIASYFLPEGTIVMQQVYSDGTTEYTKAKAGEYTNIDQIVILVNQDTASAAEVLTMALKEQRDDVTLVGTTTYGKGTVQVSQTFSDGSALKYTTSKWLSPNGVWVNDTGIEPDETVRLHDVLYTSFASMDEGVTLYPDSVSDLVKEVQLSLDFLDYQPGRTDGYFSEDTLSALQKFEQDHDLDVSDGLNSTIYDSVISAVVLEWNTTTDKDTQFQKAVEILNG